MNQKYLSTMKQMFGSVPLKKAMILTLNDMGLRPYSNTTDNVICLDNSAIGFAYKNQVSKPGLCYQGGGVKNEFDFMLPRDWDAVIEYVKMLQLPSKYKVGDKVIVVDHRNTMSSNKKLFKQLGFENKIINTAFEYGTKCKVFGVAETCGSFSYAIITSTGEESLIYEKGIKLTEEYNTVKLFDTIVFSKYNGAQTEFGRFPLTYSEVKYLMELTYETPGMTIKVNLSLEESEFPHPHDMVLSYKELKEIYSAWTEIVCAK